MMDDSKLWGASFPCGVGHETLRQRLDIASRAAIVTIPAPDERAVIAFAESQNGTGYDFWGALGLGLHRDWQDPSSWWCSEFVAAALLAGGAKLFRDRSIRRVTPEHMFMLPFEVEYLK